MKSRHIIAASAIILGIGSAVPFLAGAAGTGNGGKTLSSGDLVTVEVQGLFSIMDDEKLDLHVSTDGSVPLPFLNKGVKVAGLSVADAGRAIDKAYADAEIIKDAGTAVTLSKTGEPPSPISAGDRVRVRVWSYGGAESTKETAIVTEVAADGTIVFPGLGRANLGGLTEVAAMSDLKALYAKGGQTGVAVVVTRLERRPAPAQPR